MRKNFWKSAALLLCVATLLSSLGGCAKEKQPDSTSGALPGLPSSSQPQAPVDAASITIPKADKNTFTLGTENEPGGLDMTTQSTMGAMVAAKPVYETLIKMDGETGEFLPCLATQWEWEDDLTLAVTLRDDVFFHNGDKLTAEDVQYTITRLSSGAVTASLYSSFDGPNSVVVDDTHIKIKFSSACAPAISLLSSPGANVVCKRWVEQVGSNEFNRNPCGTGPFQFVEWVAGDHITYQRFDNYWGDKPVYQNLVLKPITDMTARMIAVESASVDAVITLTPSFTQKLLNNQVEGVQLKYVPGTYIFWLAMGESFEPFQDVRVRKAIAHAIDMNQVAAASWGANCVVMDSLYPKPAWGYSPTEMWNYDPSLAKELLAQAGYPNGFDVTFAVSEATNPSNAAEVIQAMLKEVGINMSIEKYTAATWQTMTLEGTTDFSFGGLTISTADASQVVSHLNSSASQITYRWNDPALDTMIASGMCELDEGKRAEIYQEIQRYVFENVYDIPVLNTYCTLACRDYVQGLESDSRMLLDFASVSFLG
ncbi:MAG: ABC transporter substrate-binding protein [Lawsonibacter sp.]|nr:ABC transporter substrate-binding protein [Lawsonibacter sp.]